MKKAATNIDEYIAEFPAETQRLLNQMRETVRSAAPDAEEIISYAIPSYRLNGMLVHFAGYAKHIGFYPGAGGIAEFSEELSVYKTSKGTVQFPLDQQLPLKLITKIVRSRVKQNLEKTN
ncbi:MAG: DUF1801 domain-containing protein [Pyrinomonadaceae bacterium]